MTGIRTDWTLIELLRWRVAWFFRDRARKARRKLVYRPAAKGARRVS